MLFGCCVWLFVCVYVDGLGKKAMLGWRDQVAFMFIGEWIN